MEWWRRCCRAAGNEPTPEDPFGRYGITTFVRGTNGGPYKATHHIPGVFGPHVEEVTGNGAMSFRCFGISRQAYCTGCHC